MIEQAESVCEKQIRPMLNAHGGDIRLLGFEAGDGVLRYELLGRCSGCPAASLVTEEAIRTVFLEQLPGIKDVVLVERVSDDLLAQAKKILGRHNR